MERFKEIFGLGALSYNIIEVSLVVIVGFLHLIGAEVHSWFLWTAFAAAALWTLLASTRDAQNDIQDMVLEKEIIYTDFLIGAFLLLALSTMTVQYGLSFGVIFFVAAIQNLRYSALAYDWIAKEEYEQRKRDNLPKV